MVEDDRSAFQQLLDQPEVSSYTRQGKLSFHIEDDKMSMYCLVLLQSIIATGIELCLLHNFSLISYPHTKVLLLNMGVFWGCLGLA